MKLTNENNTHLIMAAYLASDSYDYQPDSISATTLMKPIRQQILGSRSTQVNDISRFTKSRIGTSIHDGVEKVWTTGAYKKSMRALSYSEKDIDNIRVNPGYDLVDGNWELDPSIDRLALFMNEPDMIPVYVEIRTSKEIDGYIITGKFDSVTNGTVGDIKSTSTWTWINQSKTDDYQIQGSIYKWLNPGIITGDEINIHSVFTDWAEGKAKFDSKYPQSQFLTQKYPLWSIEETEVYIKNKLVELSKYKDGPEGDLPACSDKDLWRRPPVYKYYKNPSKRTRSTKNFDSLGAANMQLHKDNNVGIVVPVAGEVIACRYCSGFDVCTQKDSYLASGVLKI